MTYKQHKIKPLPNASVDQSLLKTRPKTQRLSAQTVPLKPLRLMDTPITFISAHHAPSAIEWPLVLWAARLEPEAISLAHDGPYVTHRRPRRRSHSALMSPEGRVYESVLPFSVEKSRSEIPLEQATGEWKLLYVQSCWIDTKIEMKYTAHNLSKHLSVKYYLMT